MLFASFQCRPQPRRLWLCRFFKTHIEFVRNKFGIPPNAFRHVGISAYVGLTNDLGWVAKQAGTSVEMIDERYLHAAKAGQLTDLFQIYPSDTDEAAYRSIVWPPPGVKVRPIDFSAL